MNGDRTADQSIIADYLQDLSGRIESRKLIQGNNIAACSRDSYADEAASVARLDTSVKRNTAFVKRLRNLTETQRDALLKDAAALNLTKYVEEAAAALFEARLKMADVGAAVALACFFHRRYPTFSAALYTHLRKALSVKDDDLSKLRVDLRLGAELVASHIFSREDRQSKGFECIYAALKRMVDSDARAEVGSGGTSVKPFLHLAILTSFTKYFAEEYMDIYAYVQPTPAFTTFTPAERMSMKALILETYYRGALLPYFKERFKELAALDRANRATFRAKGELHPERKEKFQSANAAFQKLSSVVKNLAAALREPVPDYALPPPDSSIEDDAAFFQNFPELGDPKSFDANAQGAANALEESDASGAGRDKYIWWDDEDTANFYRNLPDLRTFVPGILFKESASAALAPTTSGPERCDNVNEGASVTASGDAKTSVGLVTRSVEGAELNLSTTTVIPEGEKTLEDFLAISGGAPPPASDASKILNVAPTAADTASTVSSSDDLPLSLKDIDDDTLSSISNFGLDSDMETLELEVDATATTLNAHGPGQSGKRPAKSDSKSVKSGKKRGVKNGAAATPSNNTITLSSTTGNNLMKIKMDAFLTALPTKINRDLIDESATTFVMDLNTKINRKRLVLALLSVPRSRTDLLPFYARLVAALNPCMPEVGRELGRRLYSSFRYQLRKKDQVNLESKLKIVRFIAELVKFGLFAPLDACYAAYLLISDLKHHNVEMVAALLEGCGRYLVNRAETRQRAKFLLESLQRKKAALALDPRYVTLIENAYYYCLPDISTSAGSSGADAPLSDAALEATLTPERRYARHLLYHELNAATSASATLVDRLVKTARRFPWDDTNSEQELPFDEFFVDTALALSRFRYDALPALARLLSTLDVYHGSVGVLVVDTLLERLRLGVETAHEPSQASVAAAKLLGEAYNYRLVDSSVIFRALYSILGASTLTSNHLDGVWNDPTDPAHNTFRLTLALTLLESCGVYFDRGTSKKRLDCFILFLQNYYLTKKGWEGWDESNIPFPVDVTNHFRDVMDLLKPKMKLFESLEESRAAIKSLQEEYMEQVNAQIKELLSNVDEFSTNNHVGQENNGADDFCQRFSSLHPIDEETTSGEENLTQDGNKDLRNNYDKQDSMVINNELRELEEFNAETLNESNENSCSGLASRSKATPCLEDDEFLASFDNIVTESLLQRAQENVKVQNLDITLPAIVKDKTEKLAASSAAEAYPSLSHVPNSVTGDGARPSSTMDFVLVCKKGNRPQYKDVQIPYDSKLALRIMHMEEAEKKEKEQMKKLTLKITKIQEEEDYKAELIALQQKQLKLQDEMRQNLYRANVAPTGIVETHYHNQHHHHHHGSKY